MGQPHRSGVALHRTGQADAERVYRELQCSPCRSCRKHNGTAVVALAGYKDDQVSWSGDKRQIYASSPGQRRAFCGKCGTPLTWEGDGGKLGPIFELHISTFDEPDLLVPTAHAFEHERISWFDVADNLPRYQGFIDGSAPLRHGPVKDGLPQG
jgi:hypothetical protein